MAVDRTFHRSDRAHRTLRRGMRGRDAERWEVGLNARLDHIEGGARYKVKVDGVVGDADVRAWRVVRGPLGMPNGHPPTAQAQRNTRNPRTRSPAARLRARRFRAGTAKPRMFTAAQIGLTFQWVFGETGPLYRGAGHYSGSPSVDTPDELVAATRSFHGYHRGLGWGGCSYPALIGDDGTIVFANPPGRKSAQVASNNTGMVGVCIPGSTGDRITPAAEQSLRWLLANWHTTAVPAAHRLPRPARQLDWRGHKEFPGQSTSCPGDMLPKYKEIFA